MNGITLLPAADRVAQTWKNGGGVTREVATHPPGSGYDDFDWRMSVAEIHAAGPFSRFEGVDRVLAVTHGTLHFTIADAAPFLLGDDDPPYAFAGDAAVHAAPWGESTVTDCNLMIRRTFGWGRMRRLSATTSLALLGTRGTTRLLLAPHGGVLHCDGARLDLAAGDAAMIGDTGPIEIAGRCMLLADIVRNIV